MFPVAHASHPLGPDQEAIRTALDQTESFPWQDDQIRLICTSKAASHPAYGMSFREYMLKRQQFMSTEDVEKVRIVFRLPPLLTQVSADIAIKMKLSHYRFLILNLELGMINFQHDYNEGYIVIREGRKDLFSSLTTEANERTYSQLRKQTIEMVESTRTTQALTPTVPDWLGNAIKDTATSLNMTTSDFCYLCWCIGVSKTMIDENLPIRVIQRTSAIIDHFNFEFGAYRSRISSLIEITQSITN